MYAVFACSVRVSRLLTVHTAVVAVPLAAAVLQAVLRSSGNEVWEKGDNHKAKLQGTQDVSLYHEFRA